MNEQQAPQRLFECVEGDSAIVLTQPHVGTWMPASLRHGLNEESQGLPDTDWHVDRVYDALLERATVLRGTVSRYCIDLNRDPDDPLALGLYPGENTTALCPVRDFEGNAIYASPGNEPGSDEIARRLEKYFRPYHAQLRQQIERLRRRHDHVLIFECHSIRSRLPYLFDGELPLINLGTHGSRSCAAALEARAWEQVCRDFGAQQCVLNGRFRGGWTTRHYADPGRGVHCLQLELAQRAYLETERPPWNCSEGKLAVVRPRLQRLLRVLEEALGALERPASLETADASC